MLSVNKQRSLVRWMPAIAAVLHYYAAFRPNCLVDHLLDLCYTSVLRIKMSILVLQFACSTNNVSTCAMQCTRFVSLVVSTRVNSVMICVFITLYNATISFHKIVIMHNLISLFLIVISNSLAVFPQLSCSRRRSPAIFKRTAKDCLNCDTTLEWLDSQ